MFQKLFKKKDPNQKGIFSVKDSFLIESKDEFYVYGRFSKGMVEKDWYLVARINVAVSIPFRIIDIDEIRFSKSKYTRLKLDTYFEGELNPFVSMQLHDELFLSMIM